MLARGLLGRNEFVIDGDLEDAPGRGRKSELGDVGF
jgi:hypothetical protein